MLQKGSFAERMSESIHLEVRLWCAVALPCSLQVQVSAGFSRPPDATKEGWHRAITDLWVPSRQWFGYNARRFRLT